MMRVAQSYLTLWTPSLLMRLKNYVTQVVMKRKYDNESKDLSARFVLMMNQVCKW